MQVTKEQRDKLILDNQGLIHHLLRSSSREINTPLYEYEDLVQVANMALCKAIDNYDEDTSPIAFSTYAAHYILGYIKKYRDKNSSSFTKSLRTDHIKKIYVPNTVSLSEEIVDDLFYSDIIQDKEDDIEYSTLLLTIKDICDSLNNSDKYDIYEVWSKHYLQGYTGRELAKQYNVSPNMISLILKKVNSHIQEIYK